ncbi:hypothetical protein OKA05_15250 [Luteolibacter arcticus]|uniref:Uncharacterized protein n=1 Tax=Luteolibacter arcticus TaxID=1581411 RepID=A0ABT3GK79_9BACT|nr:hypothetical protein [Luteolibacter arcticus]MCW1923924.1 hypothetical protein [Luteolibacter arcticus]
MNSLENLSEVRVEFYDHSEQPLFDGYTSQGIAPIPAVGDTFQAGTPDSGDKDPTYVVERRHFHLTPGSLTARIYGRDVQVTGGL